MLNMNNTVVELVFVVWLINNSVSLRVGELTFNLNDNIYDLISEWSESINPKNSDVIWMDLFLHSEFRSAYVIC